MEFRIHVEAVLWFRGEAQDLQKRLKEGVQLSDQRSS